MSDPEKQGALFFSYRDRETVDKMKLDLKEEHSLLESMKSNMSVLSIRLLRWIGANVSDFKPCPQNKLDVLKRHVERHECHLSDKTFIYEIGYSVEGKIPYKEYTTFALSEEQALGFLEDEIVRILDIEIAPVVKKIRNYGPQPIYWCIDWSKRMIDDVDKKSAVVNG